MKTETIHWRELPADGKPPIDDACLLEILRADGSTEVWGGWWSGKHWIDDASGDRVETLDKRRVVAWAPQPMGSKAIPLAQDVATSHPSQEPPCNCAKR